MLPNGTKIRGGRSRHWLKVRNGKRPAMSRMLDAKAYK
jgi:hypothetical protein